MLESYRPLLRVWAAILSFSVIGVATLQILGPPAARGPRLFEPQTPPSPLQPSPPQPSPAQPSPAQHADQPAAAASLQSPALAELPPMALSAPPIPAQPSRRRTRSWVRKGSPARMPGGLGVGDEGVLAEGGQLGFQAEPSPQDRAALPPPAAPNPPYRAPAYQHVAGYIGIFTTGADGTRVFRAAP